MDDPYRFDSHPFTFVVFFILIFLFFVGIGVALNDELAFDIYRDKLLAQVVSSTGSNECSDGVDNNSNGKIDFDDFGCFGPNGQETNADYGFSRFYPTDTKIYYISNSEGSDNYTGLCPTAPVTGTCGPFKTFGSKAYNAQIARDGYPDWFLFKRGDTWDVDAQPWSAGGSSGANYLTAKSGRSTTQPRVYGSYGASTKRPLIVDGAIIGTGNIRNVAVMGLHFKKTNRASYLDAGIRFMSGPDNILIEDNYIQDYSANIVIEGDTQDDFVIRNNIVVDSWGYDPNSSGQERPQGLYIDRTDGVIIEGNVFDHNGWKEGVAGAQKTIYNHNVYLNGDNNNIVFRNNITARASSHGIQMRPGGEARDNLFIDNPIAGFVAHDNPAVAYNKVIGNVLLGGDGIYQSNDRGWGFDTRWNADFIGNAFAHKTCSQGEAYAMGIGMDAGKTVNLSDNVMHNWCGTLQIGGSGEGRVIITNNKFSSPSGYGFLGLYQGGVESSLVGLQFSGNSYYSNTNRNWLNIFSNAEWPAASGETNAIFGPIAFTDPDRTIETYMVSLGLAPTKAAFYAALRKQSRFSFDSRFTANAVNNYIRAGFNMPLRTSSQGTSPAGTPSTATYTITASAGSGGSISPAGASEISSGGAQDYVIAANPGYSIASVIVDGVNLGVRSSHMFTGVTADHTISVLFVAGAGVAEISGLVAHYLFDGDANDDVGSNHGTVYGGATFVPGKIGQALEFHGPCNGYCDWVLTSGPAPVSTGYTWSLWLKPIAFAGTAHGQPLLAGHDGSYSFGLQYVQAMQGEQSMNTFQQDSVDFFRNAVLGSVPPSGVWSHVAGSWDGANLKVYLNGVLQATTPVPSLKPMKGPIDIGGGIGGYAYSGAIDDVLIYNRALSANEILALYEGSSSVSSPSVPPSAACVSFAYSPWGICQSNSTQSRTILSSSPSGCIGGSPIISQSCAYSAPLPNAPSCSSFTYSDWGMCQSNSTQSRTVLGSSPSGCVNGSPITSRSCVYTSQPSGGGGSSWSSLSSGGTNASPAPSSAPPQPASPLGTTSVAPLSASRNSVTSPTPAPIPVPNPVRSSALPKVFQVGPPKPTTSVIDMSQPQCNDGYDNDFDTKVDMTDPDCLSPEDNNEIIDLFRPVRKYTDPAWVRMQLWYEQFILWAKEILQLIRASEAYQNFLLRIGS